MKPEMKRMFNPYQTCNKQPVRLNSIKWVLCFSLISGFLFSEVHHIYYDGTGDFPTIQTGIDGAEEGDTVLVYPGRYYENVIFNGKDNLTLASLDIIDPSINYIDSTIIDGNQTGSCIRLRESEQNAVIRGFTLTNGYGSYVSVHSESGGGGILTSLDISISVINCNIYNNYAVTGGGLSFSARSNVFLSGVTVKNNIGDGIRMENSTNIIFDSDHRCNVYNNYPRDILAIDCLQVDVVLDTFTVINPDQGYFALAYDNLSPHGDADFFTFDILNGWMELENQDLYVSADGDDTNSGLTPEDPLKTIAYAVHKIQSDPDDPKTVHVAAGEYHWDEGQIFPINPKSYVTISGEDLTNTILINNSLSPMLHSNSVHNTTVENLTLNGGSWNCRYIILIRHVDNFTLGNMVIEDCGNNTKWPIHFYDTNDLLFDHVTIQDITAKFTAGISCSEGNGKISNCRFENLRGIGYDGGASAEVALYFFCTDTLWLENTVIGNSAQQFLNPDGPDVASIIGIGDQQFYNSPKYMIGCLIHDNISVQDHIFLDCCRWEDIFIVNSTIVGNYAEKTTMLADGNIYNSIFMNPTDWEITISAFPDEEVILNVSHSLIEGGYDAICRKDPWGECNTTHSDNYTTVNWLEGNMDTIPYFTDAGNQDYTLQWVSPCRDAGTLDLPPGVTLPEYDLAGNPRIAGETIDIGAFEYQPDVVFEYNEDWNLVGPPVTAYEYSCPSAIENTLYAFHPINGYSLSDTLISGIGYWHRFSEAGSCVYTGPPINNVVISLLEGWNLISGVSYSTNVVHIVDQDDLIIPGTIYGFDLGYIESETLDPGKGYWVRSTGAGDVIVSGYGRPQQTKQRFTVPSDLNILTINNQSLYFGGEIPEEDKLSYSLPPKPPTGAFDARFTGDWKHSENGGIIEIMSPNNETNLQYEIKDGTTWTLISKSGDEYILQREGNLILTGGNSQYQLIKGGINSLPTEYALHQNYPNPFNPTTTIVYDVPEDSYVTLTIYDLMGRRVYELVSGRVSPGTYSIIWNGTDANNNSVASGMYLYQLKSGDFVETKKLVLLK